MKLSAKILLWLLLGTGLLDAASSTNQALVINTNNSRIANFTNFFLANTNLSVPAHSAYFTPTFVAGSAGSDFAISSSGTTHTFNLPTASALTRGLLSGADWTTFNSKAAASHTHAAADITSGTIDPARLGSGSAITTKYLRGDSTWQTVAGGGGDALVASPLSQFAATTSAQLRGVISDETGTGAAVFADNPTLTKASITTGTIATSQPALDISQTWNAGAVTFSGMKLNVTDTASAAGSLLADFQVGGSSVFSVTKESRINSLYAVFSGFMYSPTIRVSSDSGELTFGTSNDIYLRRDAANTLAQRNGTAAQSYRLYNTYTDASNYERGVMDWGTTANTLTIGTQKAGTGATRAINFVVGGSTAFSVNTSGAITSATLSAPTISGAITFPAGVRQTLAPNTTTPGLNVGSVASDPSSLSNGDVWLNSTSGRLRTRLGGASVDVATGAQQDFELTTITSGATIAIDLNATQYQTLALATDATTVTTSNRSASKGRATTIFVLASGAQRTFTLNGSWRNFNGGSTSVVIPSGKEASISLFCTGSAETDVRVVYTIQP